MSDEGQTHWLVPWEHADGSTDVDGWLTAYADDDNTFWRTAQGHIMNVVDELIDRLERDRPVGPGPIDLRQYHVTFGDHRIWLGHDCGWRMHWLSSADVTVAVLLDFARVHHYEVHRD